MKQKAYDEMSNTEDYHWWFVARRKILEDKLKTLNLPKNAKILEIGIGTGGNLEMLAKFGEVQGIEMNPRAIELAHQKTNNNFNIHEGMCPDGIPTFADKFDLICMFDVLEHIEKDEETLLALHTLLAKNGTLMITVPAYLWLWSMHDKHLHHHRRYTARRLSYDANIAGWTKQDMSYFNFMLFPVIALIRIKDKILKKDNFTGAEPPTPAINALLRRIFGFEKYILRVVKFPFGVSIIATFKATDQ
jgi:SAM-dependent methyltransferase